MKLLLRVGGLLLAVLLLLYATRRPSDDRRYVAEQALLPRVELRGDSVRIRNVRIFRHAADTVLARAYGTTERDLRDVRAVWYVLSPFASWRGPAHAFLSFEFADSTYLSVSVEARKELGESYSPVRGLLRRYELMYVIGDERDLVGLRTHGWGDPVYLYPTTATPEQAGRLLRRLLERAAALADAPEYYNTAVNNCATNLASALNEIAPRRAPWHPSLVLPGYSDTYAWRRGLLRIEGDPEAVRARYRVNGRAPDAVSDDYSRRIRSGIGG